MLLNYLEISLIAYTASASCILFLLLGYILYKRIDQLIIDEECGDEYVFSSAYDGIVIMSDSYHNRK